LQWKQVEGMTVVDEQKIIWASNAALFLPHQKTKTKTDRRVPLSTRLKAILEMRRFDPAGEPLASTAYVFGTEIGSPLLGFSRAWHTAVLKSHGHTPDYTATGNLLPECRAALAVIDLNFHDLRREAGSRWLDGGMPLHAVRDLLGHANVSQTSTYLSTTTTSLQEELRKFEARAACNEIATENQTGRQNGYRRPRGGTKSAIKSRSATMGLSCRLHWGSRGPGSNPGIPTTFPQCALTDLQPALAIYVPLSGPPLTDGSLAARSGRSPISPARPRTQASLRPCRKRA
jgi:hypothetical protein